MGVWDAPDQERSDSIAISAADLKALRDVVDASRNQLDFDPAQLGLTAQQLEIALPQLLDSLANWQPAARLDEVSDVTRGLVTLPYVAETAKRWLTLTDHGRSRSTLEVEIPGSPPLHVSSTHVPWMVPWKVQRGDDSWETYSTALPLTLSHALPESSLSRDRLDGRSYWTGWFWQSRGAWEPLVEMLGARVAQRLASEMPGYRELLDHFRIDQLKLGRFELSDSLILQLSALAPDPQHGELLDGVRWFNPLFNHRLRDDWPRLRDAVASINRAAGRFAWLREWRSRRGPRSIEGRVASDRLAASDRLTELSDHSDLVAPAWKRVGYPGKPEIELILRRSEQVTAKIYLAESSPSALIMSTNVAPGPDGKPGDHWLDREPVGFHFITVDARGRFQRR